MTIRKAKLQEAEILTNLALVSKAHWGYTLEQLAEWKEELTLSKHYIIDNKVLVLEKNHLILGFYAYIRKTPKTVDLDFLFVDPQHIRKGFGKLLITHFIEEMKRQNFEVVTVDSDPNAEKFYRHFGFETISKKPSSIKDRFLPVMKMKVV